jgi:hypothetical protein
LCSLQPYGDPERTVNHMVPSGLALHHPAAKLLTEYATLGCPTENRQPMDVTANASRNRQRPACVGPSSGGHRPVHTRSGGEGDNGTGSDCPLEGYFQQSTPELKISPIAMVPHKSRKFRAILDLSFPVRLKPESVALPSVNESTIRTAPRGAIDQLGHSLQRIIHGVAYGRSQGKNIYG